MFPLGGARCRLPAAGSAKGRAGCPVAQAAAAPSTGGDAQKSPHAAILEAIYLEWVVFCFFFFCFFSFPFRNTSVTTHAVLGGGTGGFPVVKEVGREAFLRTHKESAKMLLSSFALKLHTTTADQRTGSWECSPSHNSYRAACSRACSWLCASTPTKSKLAVLQIPPNTEGYLWSCPGSQVCSTSTYRPARCCKLS